MMMMTTDRIAEKRQLAHSILLFFLCHWISQHNDLLHATAGAVAVDSFAVKFNGRFRGASLLVARRRA